MSNLLSQNVLMTLDDVTDVEASSMGNGKFMLRAGDSFQTFTCWEDYKTYSLNIQSEFERLSRQHEKLFSKKTTEETISYVNAVFNNILESHKAGAK